MSVAQVDAVGVVAAFVVVLIALGVLMATRDVRQQKERLERLFGPRRITISPDEFFQRLAFEMADEKNANVAMAAPSVVGVYLQETPGWVIIPIILLFPIGLLFLTVKTLHTVTFVLTPDAQGTMVRGNGRLNDELARKLTRLFDKIPQAPLPGSSPSGPVPETSADARAITPVGRGQAAGLLCASCGAAVGPTAKFCGRCGAGVR